MDIRTMQYVFRRNIKKIYYTTLLEGTTINIISPVDSESLQNTTTTIALKTELTLCPIQANDRVLLNDGRLVEVISIYADSKSTNWATIRNLNSTIRITIELGLLINNIEEFIK